MLALGLLFILVAVGVTAGAIYDGGDAVDVEVFGTTIGTTASGVFMAGFATMLVFILGIWMLMSATSRGRRKRLERKETKARQRESVSQIEAERAQLRAENEQLQERLARESRPTDETAVAGTGTDATEDRPVTDQSTTADGSDRVVDHTTDLTSPEEQQAASTSARHREI
jgi:uncharacterized protein YlxW (UPF0749 family)